MHNVSALLKRWSLWAFGRPARKWSGLKVLDVRKMLLSDDSVEQEKALRFLLLYMGKYREAFPIPGEIETVATYILYMIGNGEIDWKMLIFYTGEETIVGGFHYQVLNSRRGRRWAWGEHYWGVDHEHRPEFFVESIQILRRELRSRAVSRVFLEFNDPYKMSPEEIALDTQHINPNSPRGKRGKKSFSPYDRLWFWGLLGACELVVPYDASSKKHRPKKTRVYRKSPLSPTMPYGQPEMGPEDPAVLMLSLAFIDLEADLEGETMEGEEYLELIQAAHATIPGIDVRKDPTSVAIAEAVAKAPPVFQFRSLLRRFE